MEVSTIITNEDLKRIQFLVKSMSLVSFRIIDEFPMFNGNVQIRYEMNVEEHNRLQSFLNVETPKPLTRWTRIKRKFAKWLK